MKIGKRKVLQLGRDISSCFRFSLLDFQTFKGLFLVTIAHIWSTALKRHSIIKQLQCLVYIFTAASVNFMPKWLKIVPFSYKILIVYRTFSISKWGIFCEISYLYRHQKKLVLGLVDTTSSWWKSELVETHWNSYFLG